LRVELRAGAALQLGQRALDGHARAVDARRRHRLERVGTLQDPALERDVGGGEAVGVAAAVEALVQVQDPRGDLLQGAAMRGRRPVSGFRRRASCYFGQAGSEID
jgi:hypothetical protein